MFSASCFVACDMPWDEYGGIVEGTVKDSIGNVLERVRVSFLQNGEEVDNTTTNVNGCYEKLLDAGIYTIVYKYEAYTSSKPNVTVIEKKSNKLDDIILNIK